MHIDTMLRAFKMAISHNNSAMDSGYTSSPNKLGEFEGWEGVGALK